MAREAVARVGGITLWRVAEPDPGGESFYLVEEPSRGRVTWRFDLEDEARAWAKFDERALSRTVLDLS